MAGNLMLPKHIANILAGMHPVRGLSVGARAGECLVRLLNFVHTYSYCPRLSDLAQEMGTTKSSIVRMEKDLQRANLIWIEGGNRRTMRFSKHVVVGQGVATFRVLLSTRIEERAKAGSEMAATDYDSLSHEIFERYRAPLKLDKKERTCKNLFENIYLDASGKFDFRRWSIDKFVYKALSHIGFPEYHLPERLLFESLPKSEGHELPDRGYIPESYIQNVQIAQSNPYDTMLLSTLCPFCRTTNYTRVSLRQDAERTPWTYCDSGSILANVTTCEECKRKFQIDINLLPRFMFDYHHDAVSPCEIGIGNVPRNKTADYNRTVGKTKYRKGIPLSNY